MDTNRARMQFLQNRLDELTKQIAQQNRDAEFLAFLTEVKEKKRQITPITHDAWSQMKPEEQVRNLFIYYLTLRLELETLEQELLKNDKSWLGGTLDGSLATRILTAVGLFDLSVRLLENVDPIIEAIRQSGIFYEHDKNDQRG